LEKRVNEARCTSTTFLLRGEEKREHVETRKVTEKIWRGTSMEKNRTVFRVQRVPAKESRKPRQKERYSENLERGGDIQTRKKEKGMKKGKVPEKKWL